MSKKITPIAAVSAAIDHKLPASEFKRIMELGFDKEVGKQERSYFMKVAFSAKREENAARNKVE